MPGVFPGVVHICQDDQPEDNSNGAVYVFVRNGTAWAQEAFIKSSNPGKEDWFGSRLMLSGDGNTLAVGAQVENGGSKGINGNQKDQSAEDSGALYLFSRTGTMWKQTAYTKASNADAYDEFGSAMALSRDGKLMDVDNFHATLSNKNFPAFCWSGLKRYRSSGDAFQEIPTVGHVRRQIGCDWVVLRFMGQ